MRLYPGLMGQAINKARAYRLGLNDALSAQKFRGSGTIRGDFALTVGENIVHGSDSPESAEREIAIWFPNL